MSFSQSWQKRIANNDWPNAVKLSNSLFIGIVLLGVVIGYPIVLIIKLLIINFYPQYGQLNDIVWVLVFIGFIRLSNYYGNISLLLGKEFQLTLYYMFFVLFVFGVYKISGWADLGINFFIYLSLGTTLLLLAFNKVFSFLNYRRCLQ